MSDSATPPPAPIINITGEKVALGPLRHDLLHLYQAWVNDFEVMRTLGAIPMGPITAEAEEQWYAGVQANPRERVFTIYERTTLRPVGTTALHDIDHLHRTATWGIMIGETSAWGRGYGTETARLMLDYAFTALNLHNVLLTVYDYNERGIRAYRRAGFKEIGRRRQARRLGGRAYDVIYMDCLADEFHSPVLRKLLPEEGQ